MIGTHRSLTICVTDTQRNLGVVDDVLRTQDDRVTRSRCKRVPRDPSM